MASQAYLNSANSFIQLLKEKDNALNIIGLQRLLPLIDTHWHEISEHLNTIEEFYENEKFPERQLAAFIASKIYYNLEEHQEALDLAIKSGPFFKLEENTQFTDKLINTCLNIYIESRQHNFENEQDQKEIPQDYERIVEFMFVQSINQNNFKHVIGIAVESRRLDKIQEVLKLDQNRNPNNNDLLHYLFEISINVERSRRFRIEIVKLITEFYKSKQMTPQDYINQCLCYQYYDDYESVAGILNNFISQNTENKESYNKSLLTAYQIANEISENENQFFINRVISAFPIINNNPQVEEQRSRLVKILTGEVRQKLNQIFLTSKNYSDPQLILKIKELTNQKQSITLGGVLFAHGMLNSGTCDQQFLDKNVEYVKQTNYWNKFSTVASLGVVNKGTEKSAKQVFADFIPGSKSAANQGSNPNANGGSLYGMGLMHEGSKNQEIIDYFIDILKNPEYQQNETIVHGASLGLGLVGLASEDEVIYGQLQAILNTSQSISGEAAAIGMGLVMAGSGNQLAIEELLNFAQETDRDKIVRAISLALAMIVFAKEQAADTLIEELAINKDSNIRYGACMALGMAYVGSGNNKAIKRLLNFAVTDVADDVRRQAVISLAFVMFKNPDQYLKMVKLLSISYSPHVRYGTALGIGICCAGSCSNEAYELLEPLLSDTTSFVRQAAFMGTAMVFQLANANSESKFEKFTKILEESFSKKSEEPIVKLGALVSMGILYNGGQNSVIKLASHYGFPRLGACVGMLVFSHFWHWFPLVHFYTLSLKPSAIIGVNENFRIPKSFKIKSNIKPIYTDYVPHIKKDGDKKGEKKETVNLSITARARARAQMKSEMKEGETSKVDNSSLRKVISGIKEESRREESKRAELAKLEEKMELEEQEKVQEITYQTYNNPTRVLEKYIKHISFEKGRYEPINKEKSGIVFLIDSKPEEAEEFIGEDILSDKKKNSSISNSELIKQ